MDDGGWTVGLGLLFAGIVAATLLVHRWWAAWVGLAMILPWISLVNCVSNYLERDGLAALYYPIEAVVTAVYLGVALVVAALVKRVSARQQTHSS